MTYLLFLPLIEEFYPTKDLAIMLEFFQPRGGCLARIIHPLVATQISTLS
jgi:hypothetical protein